MSKYSLMTEKQNNLSDKKRYLKGDNIDKNDI